MKKRLLMLALLLPAFAYAQQDTDSGPAITHSVITPSDSATDNLVGANGALLCRALYIEDAGDIVLVDIDNTVVTYTVAAGTILPFGPLRVNATGTTVDDMGGEIICWGR